MLKERREILAELALLALCTKETQLNTSFREIILSYNTSSLIDEAFGSLRTQLFHYPTIQEQTVLFLEDLWSNCAQLDKILSQASKSWRVDRMSLVDRSVLRLGVYIFFSLQKLFLIDTESPLTDSEIFHLILELAKKYSEKESVAFIHGVLEGARKIIQKV